MARGKFNKRGGGKRVDAQSADEIEQRNQRLAEFEEQRAQRRAEEAEEGEEEEAEKEDDATEKAGATKPASKEEPEKGPVRVTTDEEHKRNLSKLEAVRKRREVAEARRKVDEEAAAAIEAEQAMKAARLQEDHDDDDDDKKKKKKKSKEKTIPKLTKIEIKKMKPAQMKEALKERELDIQGNAKALTQRLIDYEAAR
mmetsp:Transcript_117705/g.175816  ORF Transcript_117705/g.175816 Transcript_117705/m.175816 type:complete len:198 (+) Transcript_117705:170-763(+)|eukprot:CAMPEP_0117025318 /NCGR_PEP_ID=MMETSP0472-20121206/18714_1 /TAXON_ID=693140 ORGANISM="Tiarina fusus, Strain LIS" /NCGR_SAMPLE_ID=MMETSP0472 /ASSEMBLY_ACC=CAM_ASM_000603 /LENGTH=197 /DNA_ID=CAMNT_0004731999 /DNA_START=151 /DNA_END=744 /DNA_ORIENTATION=-